MGLCINDVARLCHEANRAYCQIIGDYSQLPWEYAPEWQRESAANGVNYHLVNPAAGPAGSHENWMREKVAAGWKHGDAKDPEAKTHPCLVPYEQLPEEQRLKDAIFVGIVHSVAAVIAGDDVRAEANPRQTYSGPACDQELSDVDRGCGVREAPAPGFMQPNGKRL